MSIAAAWGGAQTAKIEATAVAVASRTRIMLLTRALLSPRVSATAATCVLVPLRVALGLAHALALLLDEALLALRLLAAPGLEQFRRQRGEGLVGARRGSHLVARDDPE